MWEKPQVDYWETQSNGYIAPPLPAWNDNPVWTADPKVTPFRDVLEVCARQRLFRRARRRVGGGDGRFRRASTCSPRRAPANKTPKAAAQRAAERAKRYYSAEPGPPSAARAHRPPSPRAGHAERLRRCCQTIAERGWRRTPDLRAARAIRSTRSRARLLDDRNVLGVVFMLPAAALLLVFLTYPLGLGSGSA